MSRTGSRRRTPADLIWGWGTEGERHPGILERLEGVEKAVSRQSRLLWAVFGAVLLDVATNSSHLLPTLRALLPTLSQFLSTIH